MLSRAPSRLLIVPLLAAAVGCPGKTTCPSSVSNTSAPVFTAALPIPLGTAIAGQESALGDALVDSYRSALTGQSPPPAVGLDIASSISGAAACPGWAADGDTIPTGTVTVEQLRDAVPTPDTLVTETLSLMTLKNILEHGVAGNRGADAGQGMIATNLDRLVQVSGLKYTADCSQQSELITYIGTVAVRVAYGSRITSLTLQGQTYTGEEAAASTVPLVVTMPTSLAQGEDEFIDLRDAYSQQGAGAYTNTKVSAFGALQTSLTQLQTNQGSVSLQIDGRILLQNCGT